jgi:hypothetical protein
MRVYDVALSGRVTGTFRVVSDTPEGAVSKAQKMYCNGVDHDLSDIEVVWAREIGSGASTEDGV